ncbi:MAG: ribonuclease PH [Parvibaculales bacterium]
MRAENRKNNAFRKISLEMGQAKNAEGSCFIQCGNTHIFCTASIEERLPQWLRGQGKGWITAEYGMLPRSTNTRMRREVSMGKPSGRTQEIQRLIGRSLRAVCDLSALGEVQITLDCDVIQADGGTRTASITAAWLALAQAVEKRFGKREKIIREAVAAISCGIVKGEAFCDLDYAEDSSAETDANFVITEKGNLVEVQASAEGAIFSPEQLQDMLGFAQTACAEITALQKKVLGK